MNVSVIISDSQTLIVGIIFHLDAKLVTESFQKSFSTLNVSWMFIFHEEDWFLQTGEGSHNLFSLSLPWYHDFVPSLCPPFKRIKVPLSPSCLRKYKILFQADLRPFFCLWPLNLSWTYLTFSIPQELMYVFDILHSNRLFCCYFSGQFCRVAWVLTEESMAAPRNHSHIMVVFLFQGSVWLCLTSVLFISEQNGLTA